MSPRPRKAELAGTEVQYSPAFEAWWKIYPRHECKREAFSSWNVAGIERDDDLLALVMKGTKSFADEMRTVAKKYIPHAATFINNQRWEDFTDGGANEGDEGEEGLFFFGGKRLS